MPSSGNHIGTLIKVHGYKGALVLSGNGEIFHKLNEGIPLFIEISEQRVPFFIEEILPDVSGKRCIVKLEFINSDKEASRYVGCEVFADFESEDSYRNDFEIAGLIGFEVHDQSSDLHFIITDFLENPGNPLFVLERTGEESSAKEEILLPAQADYIIEIVRKQKRIIAIFPEGLL